MDPDTSASRPSGALRLVGEQDVSPLPEPKLLCAEGPRRPGDRHEVVDLPSSFARDVEELASPRGLALDVAIALVVEAQWLRARIAGRDGNAIGLLDRAAEAQSHVHRSLTAADADYLRSLVMPRRTRPVQTRTRVAMPVRLLGRLTPQLVYDSGVGLARAIAWERAALLQRVTMSEWALGVAMDCAGDPEPGL